MKKRLTAAACAAWMILTLIVPAGCGQAERSEQPENGQTQESVSLPGQEPEETEQDSSVVQEPEESASETLTAGVYQYHLETAEKSWSASNGEEACTVALEYPVFEGESPAEAAINEYFQQWAEEKLAAYETSEFVQEALEMRESGEYTIPAYSDDYAVEEVTVAQGVISIRMDNYLYLGGAHGMPGRENHIFSEADGSQISLPELLSLSEDEINELARAAFLARIEEKHPEDGFFEDAAETISAKTDFISQSWLSREGVVFYTQPYEAGPYAAGFIEVTLTWEQLGL